MMNENERKIKRWLGSYRLIEKTIKAKEFHLDSFIKDMYNPLRSSNAKFYKGQNSYFKKSTIQIANKINLVCQEIMTDIENDLEFLKNANKEILEVLRILDQYENCVIYNKYILGAVWEEIPEKVGYEQRQCQRIEKRAIQKIERYLNTYNLSSFESYNKYL